MIDPICSGSIYLYFLINVTLAKSRYEGRGTVSMILSMPCAHAGDKAGREKEKARKRLIIRLYPYIHRIMFQLYTLSFRGGFIRIVWSKYRCKLQSARIKGRVSSLVVPEAAAELSQVVKKVYKSIGSLW